MTPPTTDGSDDRPARDPLTVDRLRMLREVDRAGTIAGAGRGLGLTPSAVSQQISALERATGVALLDRGGRQASLTAAGHALVVHADRVLDALEQAAVELDRIRWMVGGPFCIATIASAASAIVSPALVRLRSEHPDLEPTVIDEEPHRSLEHLDRGTVQLAVIDVYDAHPVALGPDLDAVTLLEEDLVAVVPETHPSALGEEPIEVKALATEDWVAAPAEAACGAAVRAACRTAGFEPRVRWQTDDLLLHLEHVAAGHGVALLPRLATRAAVPGVAVRPVAEATLGRSLLAVTRTLASERPAVVAVRDALVTAAAAIDPG